MIIPEWGKKVRKKFEKSLKKVQNKCCNYLIGHNLQIVAGEGG
jgi:hypothetical protein